MSLLKAFNLEVIDKIFKQEAQEKISVHAKMLYINCLTHQFGKKELKLKNAHGFELFEEDVKDYKKYEPLFRELHKAGLVSINAMKMINFNNVWGKHLDRTIFEQAGDTSSIQHGNHLAAEFTDELYNSHGLIDLCGMKYRVTKSQVNKLLQLFFKEQETFEKKYVDEGAVRKHFVYWIKSNLDKLGQQESVKSTGKILGKQNGAKT